MILAPAAGRVLRIHTHPGERVSDAGVFESGKRASNAGCRRSVRS